MTSAMMRLSLAGLGGALLVALAWIATRHPGTARETESEGMLVARELGEVARTQERILVALERLAAHWEDELVPPSGSAVRAELGADVVEGPSLDELVESLAALRASLETESRRTQDLLRSAPALGGESLLETRQRRSAVDWPALERLEQSWRADARAADRSQYFQSARDLLETYGPPTAIYRQEKGGMLFHYSRSPKGVSGSYFRLHDGIVIEFFVQDPKGE